MACFLVPAAEAIAVTVAVKVLQKKEEKAREVKLSGVEGGKALQNARSDENERTPFSKKLGLLSKLLWGGIVLLAFEHLWHGEIVPYFPFLSAAANPADTVQMLHEMSTVGVCMALAVTGVWFVMLAFSAVAEKKAEKEKCSAKEGV